MNKLFVLPLILISLLLAIWSGWLRMGWAISATSAAAHHGALMTGSFLATLIFLERAVTFRNSYILLLPVINGLSVVFFIFHQPGVAHYCLIAGSALFFIMCCYFIYQYKALYYYVFLAGAFSLLAGNIIVVKTGLYPAAVVWWMAFLLFTIVAERLELSRFLPLNGLQKSWLLVSLANIIIALFLPFHGLGKWVFCSSIISVAIWLLLNDMARLGIKASGQHRYSAILLLAGYVWLLVTALLFLAPQSTFTYDAALHAFFIGFVFSMIFSHAPIILPAVLKLPIKLYRPVLYYWFIALQLSLLLRVTGDLLEHTLLRKWGGMLNGIFIILFFVTVFYIVWKELQSRERVRQSQELS